MKLILGMELSVKADMWSKSFPAWQSPGAPQMHPKDEPVKLCRLEVVKDLVMIMRDEYLYLYFYLCLYLY